MIIESQNIVTNDMNDDKLSGLNVPIFDDKISSR